jgi:hypothetical protein
MGCFSSAVSACLVGRPNPAGRAGRVRTGWGCQGASDVVQTDGQNLGCQLDVSARIFFLRGRSPLACAPILPQFFVWFQLCRFARLLALA